jgi:hypothetical protein
MINLSALTGLSAARPAYDAHLLTSLDSDRYAFKSEWEVGRVSHCEIFDANISICRPVCGRSVLIYYGWWLLRN